MPDTKCHRLVGPVAQGERPNERVLWLDRRRVVLVGNVDMDAAIVLLDGSVGHGIDGYAAAPVIHL
jgi:hypothetical protein